jgi:hypothetical protein
MDRGYYTLFSMLGMFASLAVFYPLGAKRRARIPRFVWWISIVGGSIVAIFGLQYATVPSFAPRVTAVGKAYNHVEVRRGRDTHYGFDFVPSGSEPIHLETSIILPGWGNPDVFNGRTFRVIYLQSTTRPLKNEALYIEILFGRDTGFHDFVDARVAGIWLAVPIGAAFVSFGVFGLKYKDDDEKKAWQTHEEASSQSKNPLDIDLFKPDV